ncbi:PQQ-binding-like beta-propeller repeat protein [Haloarcula sp. S1CR25-12]|uniref:PQQ-binding-like beta-propeller repeat protein n=1 Tax=Haloarcula saliterrae TaxID=2950534 RepID=A0ABU2FCI9_9EURY|nr:PQQ-binding-like beta-propeller repeat protein [Haloarcula sp. S1CR25-12]MDS0259430.1 PQQ-binding-like beta-propeller repeat protein [Haloarcula sp. S1CR25-12]
MPSRRQVLAAGSLTLSILAGCTDDGTQTPSERQHDSTETRPRTTTRPTVTETGPTETDAGEADDEPASWGPSWSLAPDIGALEALVRHDGVLYGLFNDTESGSTVARIDPANERLAWQRELDGVAAEPFLTRENTSEQSDVTVVDGTVYAVTRARADYEWTALHALDAETGSHSWSVQRERKMALVGVTDGTVVAAGEEFFENDSLHSAPEEPLRTVCYGLDSETGSVRWTRDFTGVDAATAHAGGVAVGNTDGVTRLDAAGGRQWTVSMPAPLEIVTFGDAVVLRTETIDSYRLRAFDADRTERWSRDHDVDNLLVGDGQLYGLGHETVALDTDGTVAWQVDVRSLQTLVGPNGETLYARSGRPSLGQVDAYALPSGDRRFRYDSPAGYVRPIAATDGTVVLEAYAPDPRGFMTLYAVDATSGEQLGVYWTDDSIHTAVSLGDSGYVGIGDRLLAFDSPA